MKTHMRTHPWPIVLLLIFAAFILPACAKPDPPSTLAIVYSARSNQPQYDFTGSEHLKSLISSAIGTQISIVSSDGMPAVQATIDTDISYAHNRLTRSDARTQLANQVIAELTKSEAKSPESDVLSAIALAAASLQDSPGTRSVFVCDSGLTTVAPIALQQTALLAENSDIESAVEDLVSHHALPDLTNVKISWMCLGVTADPQPSLDIAAKERLKTLWSQILEKAGASVEFRGDLLDASPSPISNTPKVSAVPVEAVTLGSRTTSVSITLPETELAFLPDSAQYLNPDQAHAIIEETATRLRQSGVPHVSVTGCTATWGRPEYRQQLSQQRADAVATSLRASGIEVTSVLGLGSDCPGKIHDLDETGELIESLAASNRRVILSAQ